MDNEYSDQPPLPPVCPECRQQVTTMMVYPDQSPCSLSPCGHAVEGDAARSIALRFKELQDWQYRRWAP